MGHRPLTTEEAERLRELNSYGVMDTPGEKEFDDIAMLASHICETPLAAISFLDADRTWFKSRVGFNIPHIAASDSFCRACIDNPDEVLMVEDLTKAARFCVHPVVVDKPLLRFYAGAAIVTETGEPLGTVCVLDLVPRRLTAHQQYVLRTLSQQVMNLLTLRRLQGDYREIESRLRESETRFRAALQCCREGFVVQRAGGEIVYCNHSAETILGLTADQIHGRTSVDPRWNCIREDGTAFPGAEHPAMVSLNHGISQTDVIMGVRKPNGTTTWISINSSPLFRVGEKTPYSVVVSFVDITEQRTGRWRIAEAS